MRLFLDKQVADVNTAAWVAYYSQFYNQLAQPQQQPAILQPVAKQLSPYGGLSRAATTTLAPQPCKFLNFQRFVGLHRLLFSVSHSFESVFFNQVPLPHQMMLIQAVLTAQCPHRIHTEHELFHTTPTILHNPCQP